MQEVLIKVVGEVQAVGFRYAAREKARELGLKGWVRNAADGTVEILAQGEHKPDLEKLVAWAKTGPPGAEVAKVTATWGKPQENFSEFLIAF